MKPPGRATSSTGARSTLIAVGAQAGAGGGALRAGGGRAAAAHLGGAHLRRPGQPLDQAALLVGGDQHRLAQTHGPVGRLDRAGQSAHRPRFEPMLSSNRITPGQLARSDRPQQAGGGAPAVEAADDPLAGELAGGEVGGCVRLRRVGCGVDAGAIPPGAGHPKHSRAGGAQREQSMSSLPRPHCRVDSKHQVAAPSGRRARSRRASASGTAPSFRPDAAADQLRRGPGPGRADRPRRDRRAGRARLGGAHRPLRRLDRHVLAGQRQVRRLRRGLRLLRPVALRRGRHADARDDGARADPGARQGRRGGGRAPLLHGHPGPGAVEEGLREDPRGRASSSASRPTSSAAPRSATCRRTAPSS